MCELIYYCEIMSSPKLTGTSELIQHRSGVPAIYVQMFSYAEINQPTTIYRPTPQTEFLQATQPLGTTHAARSDDVRLLHLDDGEDSGNEAQDGANDRERKRPVKIAAG